MNKTTLRLIATKILPAPVYRWLVGQIEAYRHNPPLGKVRWGDLGASQPVNAEWGFNRGQPVDRYYIENFLANQSNDIKGRVLSVGDDYYTQVFGSNVTHRDVLHIQNNPKATIVADLADAPQIAANTFDCFLLVQTLQLIYEVPAALKTTYRILKPGGVVLATFPAITPLKDQDWNDTWYWNFTAGSAQRLFEEAFPTANIRIESYGNSLAATAFLHGLASQEIPSRKLDEADPRFPVILTVRATKPLDSSATEPEVAQ
jgi:SAM-dependent methyltransferase